MNPDTEQVLKLMGFLCWDDTPDAEDGTITYFIPEVGSRPRFTIKLFPKATPTTVLHAIWNAGGDEKKKEIAKARESFLSALS